jgi:uncharacterized protein (DUF924 family)
VSIADQARSVISFWFDEVGPDKWFVKDLSLDEEIARRFGKLREEIYATAAAGWRANVEVMTAAIVLLDQFSRNIFRGSAKAFEADPLALELALESLERGWTHSAPREWRAFLLMPLMHSENLAIQNRSVAEFRVLGELTNLEFAIKHKDQIGRFGRFPGRNKALGRLSSPEESVVIESGEVF